MPTSPQGLYYSESHEYVKIDGDYGYIGITDFAQSQLGNVVYVDAPEPGDEVTAGEPFGAVESVKAASDLISPDQRCRGGSQHLPRRHAGSHQPRRLHRLDYQSETHRRHRGGKPHGRRQLRILLPTITKSAPTVSPREKLSAAHPIKGGALTPHVPPL